MYPAFVTHVLITFYYRHGFPEDFYPAGYVSFIITQTLNPNYDDFVTVEQERFLPPSIDVEASCRAPNLNIDVTCGQLPYSISIRVGMFWAFPIPQQEGEQGLGPSLQSGLQHDSNYNL